MKIVGGTFGTSGSAFIGKDNTLVVEGAKTRRFTGVEISALNTRLDKEKKFGCFSFIVGAVIFSIIFGLFLGPLGVVIAIVISAFGSFYANAKNMVDLDFTSGDKVTLEVTPRQMKKLVNLKP